MSRDNPYAGGSEFSCRGCSNFPRNPCLSPEEVMRCPNALHDEKRYARSLLPGYDQGAEDELAEYRRRYGPLPGRS